MLHSSRRRSFWASWAIRKSCSCDGVRMAGSKPWLRRMSSTGGISVRGGSEERRCGCVCGCVCACWGGCWAEDLAMCAEWL